MPTEPKYTLSAPTESEQNSFMKEFTELCNTHSMYFEPVPQWSRKSLTDPWQTTCQIFLQKKTEVVDVEVEKPVASTDPEINPNA